MKTQTEAWTQNEARMTEAQRNYRRRNGIKAIEKEIMELQDKLIAKRAEWAEKLCERPARRRQ